MTLKIRSRPPKVDRVIALPQGLIYVSLIILGLILFLESCPQSDTDYAAAAAHQQLIRTQTDTAPKKGSTWVKSELRTLPFFQQGTLNFLIFQNQGLLILLNT